MYVLERRVVVVPHDTLSHSRCGRFHPVQARAGAPSAHRFYNPTLYKAPERRELTEEERIYVAEDRAAEEPTEFVFRSPLNDNMS